MKRPLLALALSLAACGAPPDVVKGTINGFGFDGAEDVTFDVADVDVNGTIFTVGVTVLYNGSGGFCLDLSEAVGGDQQALARIEGLDHVTIVNAVNQGANPNVVDGAVSLAGNLKVNAVFDATQSDGGVFATGGTVTMDFDSGFGDFDVDFGGDGVRAAVEPLNVRCAGMAQALQDLGLLF
jgi:hypothetical protein